MNLEQYKKFFKNEKHYNRWAKIVKKYVHPFKALLLSDITIYEFIDTEVIEVLDVIHLDMGYPTMQIKTDFCGVSYDTFGMNTNKGFVFTKLSYDNTKRYYESLFIEAKAFKFKK